jgi:MoaA/NifB/PqqE/SkfB family radical SAM enzyme
MEPREYSLLDVRAGVDDKGQVDCEGLGLLGGMLDGMIKQYFSNLNRKKIIAQREGGNVYTLYQPPIPSQAAFKLPLIKLVEAMSGKHLPTTATIAITNACQCDCVHCSAMQFRRNPRPTLSKAEMLSLIDQAQELGVVNMVFTGGEPTLHPHLFDYIRHVDYAEARPMIFSNGLALTDDMIAKLKDAGLYSINVSLDHIDPERHDTYRGVEGCWQAAVEGATRAVRGGLLTGFSTYASPEAVEQGNLQRMMDLTKDCGLHELTIFDVVPTGRLLRGYEDTLLSEAHKAEIRRLSKIWSDDPNMPGVQAQAHVNSAWGFGCFAGYFQFYATAAGDITPCDFTPLTFGNIREEPLRVIWERMTSHEAYRDRCDHCRMQDPQFRAKYIDHIPDDADLPFPAYERAEAAVVAAK